MEPLIKCEHVDLGYENQDAVINVNMEVCPGDYLCIVGENGSGKSTLIKGLLGLLKPSGGKLTVAEELKTIGTSSKGSLLQNWTKKYFTFRIKVTWCRHAN